MTHRPLGAMLQGVKGVKYGLTVPDSKNKKKKQALNKPAALSAFGDEGSDDEHEAVPQQLARQAASKKLDSKVVLFFHHLKQHHRYICKA